MKTRKLSAIELILAVLLAGCSGRGGSDVKLDVNEAAQTIVEQVDFTNQLVKAEGNAAANYYMLDDSVVSYAIYIDISGGSAEEVAVLEAAGDDDVSKVQNIIDMRVEDLKFMFENYRPEQMLKLNDPVIETQGRYVILVLADDARVAGDVVAGLFK